MGAGAAGRVDVAPLPYAPRHPACHGFALCVTFCLVVPTMGPPQRQHLQLASCQGAASNTLRSSPTDVEHSSSGAETAPGRPPTISGHHPTGWRPPGRRHEVGELMASNRTLQSSRLAAQSACSASRACKQLPAAHEVACKQFNIVATLPPPPSPPPGGGPPTILISVQSQLSTCRQTRMASQAQIRIKRIISKHACMHACTPPRASRRLLASGSA